MLETIAMCEKTKVSLLSKSIYKFNLFFHL